MQIWDKKGQQLSCFNHLYLYYASTILYNIKHQNSSNEFIVSEKSSTLQSLARQTLTVEKRGEKVFRTSIKEKAKGWMEAYFNNANDTHTHSSFLLANFATFTQSYPNTLFIMNEWIKRWLTEFYYSLTSFCAENVFSREHKKKVKTEVKTNGEIIFPPLQINQQQRKMWGRRKSK